MEQKALRPRQRLRSADVVGDGQVDAPAPGAGEGPQGGREGRSGLGDVQPLEAVGERRGEGVRRVVGEAGQGRFVEAGAGVTVSVLVSFAVWHCVASRCICICICICKRTSTSTAKVFARLAAAATTATPEESPNSISGDDGVHPGDIVGEVMMQHRREKERPNRRREGPNGDHDDDRPQCCWWRRPLGSWPCMCCAQGCRVLCSSGGVGTARAHSSGARAFRKKGRRRILLLLCLHCGNVPRTIP